MNFRYSVGGRLLVVSFMLVPMCAFSSAVTAQTEASASDAPTESVAGHLLGIESQVKRIDAEQSSANTEFDLEVENRRSQIASEKPPGKDAGTTMLYRRLLTLEAADSLIERKLRQNLSQSFSAGSIVLTHIEGATRTITFYEELLKTEIHVGRFSNPWFDEDLRNAYDEIKSWGTIGGLGGMLAGVIASDSDDDTRTTLTTGFAVAMVSQLVGHLFGEQSGLKFNEKAEYVEFTRRAYDDIHTRDQIMTSYISRNRAVLKDLSHFQILYNSAATDSQKAEHLLLLDSHLAQFTDTVAQVQALIDLYGQLVDAYLKSVENGYQFRYKYIQDGTTSSVPLRNDALFGALEEIAHTLQQLRGDVPAVKNFLEISPNLRKSIGSWRDPMQYLAISADLKATSMGIAQPAGKQ